MFKLLQLLKSSDDVKQGNVFLCSLKNAKLHNSTILYVRVYVSPFVSYMYHMYQILCVNSPVCV